MSDNMQRDKNELTAKEREEVEEMKKELKDMKMYETGYTYKYMKQILGVIHESKNMAIAKNDEKNIQKELLHSTNNCSRDVMPETNLTQELETQEHNRISPIREQTVHGCSNPDFESIITESRTSMYRGKNVDGESLFVKLQDNSNIRDNYSHNINRYVPSKSKNSLQDSNIMHSIEIKMDTHSECEQKLERWQINPLDSYVSENDVPLQEPNRPVGQDRMPFRLCKEAQQAPEMLDKLIQALNIHLKQTAELWHSWHRTTSTKFQWGSPIQVGLAKDKSDKKSLSDIITEQDQMECTSKHNNERSNKRKSTLILSSNIGQCSDDEDEKIVKKQKIRSYEDTNKVSHLYKDVRTVIHVESDQNLNNDNFNKDSDNIEIDNYKTEPKRNTEERLSPELVSSYPRRIAPPNVRKNISKRKEHAINVSPTCSVTHVSDEKQSAISLISKEKNNILSDEEIFLELEKNDIKASENIEIKPLPMKGLSRRIKGQCIVLEKIQLEKQKKVEIEKEEAQKKENEERRKREEFYKKQIIETQKREQQKEEIEKFREERSKKWNSVVDMKSQKKVNKDQGKLQNVQDEIRPSERVEETRLFQESSTFVNKDVEIIENDSTNNVNCPICNKSFPTDKIETHAAGCEQYMTENECANSSHLKNKVTPMNSNNSEILECSVCSKFRTTNGIDYEDHVNSCLQKHEDQSIHEHTSADVINVPNSPIRCYRPISEQTDSYIDYRKQFNSNNKTQTRSSKKRKR